MQEPSNIRHEVAAHIKNLPAEQVKIAVLKWLDNEGELEDLEQQLEQNQLTYGTVDDRGDFTSLTEEGMIDLSLDSLEEYKKSGHSIPQEAMQQWANSLGTDNQLPCPQ